MTVPLVLSLIGYAVLLGVNIDTQKGIAYMAIFFCTIGVSLSVNGDFLLFSMLVALTGTELGISNECDILRLDSGQYPKPEHPGLHHRCAASMRQLHGLGCIEHLSRSRSAEISNCTHREHGVPLCWHFLYRHLFAVPESLE